MIKVVLAVVFLFVGNDEAEISVLFFFVLDEVTKIIITFPRILRSSADLSAIPPRGRL